VPLAVVTVAGKDCRVIEVCNWTLHRKILLTWPTMAYWFSWLPLFKTLRQGMHDLCCELFGLRRQPPGVADVRPEPAGRVGLFASGISGEEAEDAGPRLASGTYFRDRSSFVTAAIMRMPRMPASMAPAEIADALFRRRGADETVAVSDENIATVPEFRLLNHLAAPLVSGLGLEGLMAVLGPEAGPATHTKAAAEADVVELRQQVRTLQAALKSQAATIEGLAARVDRTG
jgi:hypothetical protein